MTSAPVRVFESHDEAYHIWRAAGVSRARVVHVDAHHDLSWLDDPIHLHIGNYLCQAIKDGIASEVCWVVPDGALGNRRSRAEIRRQLRTLRADYRASGTALLGCPLVVCELRDISPPTSPVLLDIDTDFLVTDGATFHTGFPSSAPWLLPETLIERLGPIVDRAEVVTIAYSVEGGYTPLRWKFLGDELAARLNAATPAAEIAAFERLHEAHRLMADDRLSDAEAACRNAAAQPSCAAAATYALALCLERGGCAGEARTAHLRARTLDPSYDTAYGCDGFAALESGRVSDAERAFNAAVALEAADAYAHYGLARVAAERGGWAEAERSIRHALALGAGGPDSFRLLARSLERQGRTADAVAAMKQSLKAGLHGQRTVHGALASRTSTRLPVHDTGHARAFATLARLEARLGHVGEAIAALRLAISAGYRAPSAHARLAHLYTTDRRWRAALREVGRALALLPAVWARSVRHGWRNVAARIEALA